MTNNGPIIDDFAPHSSICMEEHNRTAPSVIPTWNFNEDPVPGSVSARLFLQYGVGVHGDPLHRILLSVLLPPRADAGAIIMVRHLVWYLSSQWVIRGIPPREEIF